MSFVVPQKTVEGLFAKGKFLITDVTFETIQSLVSWIVENRPAKKEFTILINSSGGSPKSVLYLASVLGTLSVEVKLRGVAFGECGSAALALLQCCHERIAVKHCGFFIHHIETTLEVNCQDHGLRQAKASLEHSRSLEDDLVRLQCKRSGMSRAAWMKLADRGAGLPGRAILPREAHALGLVDKIVEQYPIF